MSRATWGWSLVGRARELELIGRLRVEGARGVVLAGAAGVGKSRLAQEVLAHADRQGASTRWIQATRSAASVPLGAFAPIIPDDGDVDEPLALMRLVRQRLLADDRDGELVLGIDDAQLLDPASAALVLQIVQAGDAFVTATIRSGEPAPDAVVSLWKDAGLRRLELGLLSGDETGQLAERIVDGPIEQLARRWIFEISLGNALYVRELMLGALAGGAMRQISGLWRMPVRPPVSASLGELVTVRMTGLDDAERQVLELLALGEPLQVSEMITMTGRQALERVEARGLVTVRAGAGAGDAEVRLAHPLYAEVLRVAQPTFRGRQLRMQLAATVSDRRSSDPADVLRHAHWLLDAGEPIPTALAIRAGRAANLTGDPELAVQLATVAANGGGGIEAALVLARAHTMQNHHEQAAAVLAGAESDIENRDSALSYLEQQIDVLYVGLKRADELGRLLDRARGWWPEPDWRRRVDQLRPVDYTEGAPDSIFPSDPLTDDRSDPEARRRMAPLQIARLFYAGQALDAYELARRTRATPPLRDRSDELSFMLFTSVALETGEGWQELRTWASDALAISVRLGDRAGAGLSALALGGLCFSQGRYADAGRWLAESELQLERHDAGGLLAITTSMQVGVACFTGNLDGIPPALERCRAALGGADPLPNQLAYVVRAEAWAANAEGDPPRAQAMLLKTAEQLSNMPVLAARLTYEAMRAGAPARRVAPALAELAERCDARLVAAYCAHAAARAADDGPALFKTAGEMEEIGAYRYATEAAAHAAGAFSHAGLQDSARRAAARSRDLHSRGQDGIAPRIEGVDSAATSLTRREQQLVDLASRGLSNAEIADRLVLSIRTVESHLYRAMQKLGVSDRRDL